MPATYRTRTEIVSDILNAANNGAEGITKTKIMYRAFLSYAQLGQYVEALTDKGLLERDKQTLRFRITEKGRNFLKAHERLEDYLPSRSETQRAK